MPRKPVRELTHRDAMEEVANILANVYNKLLRAQRILHDWDDHMCDEMAQLCEDVVQQERKAERAALESQAA
jgi:hypothetical protein